jgi:NADPH2:quinone reductase
VLRPVELPEPVPGPGEVLIDVEVAAITFIETQVRAGRSPRPGPSPFPLVPGNGVGGTIVAVGPGVDDAAVGRRVVSATGASGGYAERVVVGAAEPYDVPARVDLRTAVALLADGRTALGLARAADLGRGDRVLVTAAGGGVGSLLVQLARRAGASAVVALAGDERKRDLARSLGADVAVDYRRDGWVAEARAALALAAPGAAGAPVGADGAGGGVDVAFDGVGGDVGAGVVELLAPGARLVVHGMAGGPFTRVDPAVAEDRGLTVLTLADVLPTPDAVRAATADALAAAAEGWLAPTIGQTFPLDRAADAHAAIEARATLGKTLLLTGRPTTAGTDAAGGGR